MKRRREAMPRTRPDWFDDALCRDHPKAELWFQEVPLGRPPKDPHDDQVRRELIEAKQVCYRCSVRDECLEFGIEEDYGIWGGLGRAERKALRKHRKAEQEQKVG